MVGPISITRPAARTASKRGVAAAPHPKIQQFRTQSEGITIHPPFQKGVPHDGDLTKYQGDPNASIHSCANIFADNAFKTSLTKSLTAFEKVAIQITISQFFANLWNVDSWGLDTVFSGILETQQPIIQFATTVIDGGKQVLLSSLPPDRRETMQLSDASETFQDPPCATRKYTAAEIAKAIDNAGGKIKIAAIKLGVTRESIYKRIREAQPDSPLAQFKSKKRGRKPKHSDKEIAAALKEASGKVAGAAKKLGVCKETVSRRIRLASEGTPLAKYKRIRRGGKPKYSDKQIAAALEEANRVVKIASENLEISTHTIWRRIRLAPKDSPLAKYRDRKKSGKRGRKPKYSDKEIAAALKEASGNRGKAVKTLGISRSAISDRIRRASKSSPLAKYKDGKMGGKRGRKPKFTDDEIAQAIEDANGVKSAAAEKLEITRATINLRIKKASKDSPLAKYKDGKMSVKRGRKPKFTDDEIAQAIEDAGGDKKAAAKKLGIGQTTIYSRIKQAELGTPLSLHKRYISDANFLSDQVIADRLSEHDGDKVATARSLWTHPDVIHVRILVAKETSPLAKFKKGLIK